MVKNSVVTIFILIFILLAVYLNLLFANSQNIVYFLIMKQLRFLCIQGKYARGFHLNGDSIQSFRSLVESMTLSSALVISSPYRSDLLYHSDEDISLKLLRVWCAYKGSPYQDAYASRFTQAFGIEETLEFFFVKLTHLSRRKTWLHPYTNQFTEICLKEPNHELLKPLLGCNKFLRSRHLPDIGLADNPVSKMQYTRDNFHQLATNTLIHFIGN